MYSALDYFVLVPTLVAIDRSSSLPGLPIGQPRRFLGVGWMFLTYIHVFPLVTSYLER
jgi:hypothetical protein